MRLRSAPSHTVYSLAKPRPSVVDMVCVFDQRHPTLYTVLLSLAQVLLTWPLANGRVIFESVIITTVLVMSLTLYTFWAAKKGHDLHFLFPFLFGTHIVLLVYGVIQTFLGWEMIVVMIFGALSVTLFSGYIVYQTDNLIKSFSMMNTYGILFLYALTSMIFVLIITLLGD
ncbi:protein LIFEGUARD 4-like [Tasmannia lanceolata]|uniref:protein LIFEGUARD 4-like n=1 Tax=Tasmannia lanceolata TaxID=3420 RepID=UPI004062889A